MSTILSIDHASSTTNHFDQTTDIASIVGETPLTVEETCKALKVSRAWLYSPAGRAVVGSGFKLGGSRRYRASVIARLLRA
jgi:hypothetical protein